MSFKMNRKQDYNLITNSVVKLPDLKRKVILLSNNS